MINILGINVSTLNKKDVLKKVEQFLNSNRQHYIVTPNPEIILAARKDEEFFYILNKADMAIPDGIGLKFAAWARGRNLSRVTGADLVRDIVEMAARKKLQVGIINWGKGLSNKQDIEEYFRNNYPDLNFTIIDFQERCGVQHPIGCWTPLKNADILFCTFGAPYQEKFIYHNLKNLLSVKVAIGIGGAFDFLTGKIKRAPRFMQILGLEWLWRLFKQPRRWKRIYDATIKFPREFFKWKFIKSFLYRPNVVCLLYKGDKTWCKILLVERKVEPGHWQLPQGGTDNENLMTAGIRELSEEIGNKKFKPIATFKNLWQYKFNNEKSKFETSAKNVWGYKGQEQSLFIAKFLGKDSDIKINFWDHSNWKWAEADNLVNEVHPLRREATKIFLKYFKKIISNY